MLEEFCEAYGLGKVMESVLTPKGLTNRTYIVKTTQSKYVIKALNPQKVATEKDRQKIETSEIIAQLANQAGIPSIYAKRINNRQVHEFHGQFYIVFDFSPGKVINISVITPEICHHMGSLLATLHNTKFEIKSQKYRYARNFKAESVNWNYYFNKLSNKKKVPKWLFQLEKNTKDLYDMFELARSDFIKFNPLDTVVSHGDMFSHNVLWHEDIPYIIDWETSGVIDATYDCIYTAMRWSMQATDGQEKMLNKEKLFAFLKGYAKLRRIDVKRLDIVLSIIWYRRLLYLRDALRRYLKPEDKTDKKRASRGVAYNLSILKCYKEFRSFLPDVKKYIIKQQPAMHSRKYYFLKFLKRIIGRLMTN